MYRLTGNKQAAAKAISIAFEPRSTGDVRHEKTKLTRITRARARASRLTGPSDRGENHDPGTATEAIKMQLTGETRLENGPGLRRMLSSVLAKWSGAVICPALRCGAYDRWP
jgi:hypothetical protein